MPPSPSHRSPKRRRSLVSSHEATGSCAPVPAEGATAAAATLPDDLIFGGFLRYPILHGAVYFISPLICWGTIEISNFLEQRNFFYRKGSSCWAKISAHLLSRYVACPLPRAIAQSSWSSPMYPALVSGPALAAASPSHHPLQSLRRNLSVNQHLIANSTRSKSPCTL
jgi:hypothetical protein